MVYIHKKFHVPSSITLLITVTKTKDEYAYISCGRHIILFYSAKNKSSAKVVYLSKVC
jgi:hypothetical protein